MSVVLGQRTNFVNEIMMQETQKAGMTGGGRGRVGGAPGATELSPLGIVSPHCHLSCALLTYLLRMSPLLKKCHHSSTGEMMFKWSQSIFEPVKNETFHVLFLPIT